MAHTTSLDVVLLDLSAVGIGAQSVIEQISQLSLPTMLVVDAGFLPQYDPTINPDDFIIAPLNASELVARVGQIVFPAEWPEHGPSGTRGASLTIDLQSYEVTMAGRRISLTYKEFQLLTLLASNPGRVYTREALLNQVWGTTTWAARGRWTCTYGGCAQRWRTGPPVCGDDLERGVPFQGRGVGGLGAGRVIVPGAQDERGRRRDVACAIQSLMWAWTRLRKRSRSAAMRRGAGLRVRGRF